MIEDAAVAAAAHLPDDDRLAAAAGRGVALADDDASPARRGLIAPAHDHPPRLRPRSVGIHVDVGAAVAELRTRQHPQMRVVAEVLQVLGELPREGLALQPVVGAGVQGARSASPGGDPPLPG